MKFNKKIADLIGEMEELKKNVWKTNFDFDHESKRHSNQFYCYQMMMTALQYQMLANELEIELMKLK